MTDHTTTLADDLRHLAAFLDTHPDAAEAFDAPAGGHFVGGCKDANYGLVSSQLGELAPVMVRKAEGRPMSMDVRFGRLHLSLLDHHPIWRASTPGADALRAAIPTFNLLPDEDES